MAWAEPVTLLSLAQWADVMGIDPFEFAQIDSPRNRSAGCDSVWYQYQWQQDFLSRQELAEAIDSAEHQLAHVLNYWPGPKYTFEETVQYPQVYDPEWRGTAGNPDHSWKAIRTRWNRFIAGGQRNRTDIQTSAVTYTDLDNDGVDDHFTCTATITGITTDPDEVGIYFVSADRFGEPVSEKWRIRPVNVTISGATATITGHISLLVFPNLQTVAQPVKLSTADNIYVANVEVKRVYHDDRATDSFPIQGVAVWDVPLRDSVTPAIAIEPLNLGSRLNNRGMPYATFGAPSSWPYAWEPNRVIANYLSGIPEQAGRIPTEQARWIARLATGLLPSEKCGCERSNRIIHYWRMRVDEGDDGRNFTLEEINQNPFGEPTRGALWVWKQLRLIADQEIVRL